MLITGDRYLRRALGEYADHDSTHRPHRALNQNPPAGRADPAAAVTNKCVLRRDSLGGLIHENAVSAPGSHQLQVTAYYQAATPPAAITSLKLSISTAH